MWIKQRTLSSNFQKLSKHLNVCARFKVHGTWNFEKWESTYVFEECMVNKESCCVNTGQGQ